MKHFTLLVLMAITISLNGQIFVDIDATGANDGSSWENAYTSFSDAIANHVNGMETWVAEGTYRAEAGDRDFAFSMTNAQFIVYGGFNGTETSRDQRDAVAHPTILSGDVNGDDIPGDLESNRSDNFPTVLRFYGANLSAIVDLTIAGGGGEELSDVGGGISIGWRELVIRCTFRDNKAINGGAVGPADLRTPPAGTATLFEGCIFENNQADQAGGAIYSKEFNFNPTIEDSHFESNSASAGGAIYMDDSIKVETSVFVNNRADSIGGAIFSDAFFGNSAIDSCTFTENEAPLGGGLAVVLSDVTMSECHFINNKATSGGGIHGDRVASIYLDDCNLTGNEASDLGGGIHLPSGFEFVLNRCVIDSNTARVGGGIAEFEITFDHQENGCSYSGNTAVQLGGAIYSEVQMEIKNANFHGNSCANFGGALIANDKIVLDSCNFSNNAATGEFGTGGAVSLSTTQEYTEDPYLRNCTFVENEAQVAGGAVYIENSDMDIHKCEFLDNEVIPGGAYSYGGAINVFSTELTMREPSISVQDCLFEGNSSADAGGAISLGLDNIGPRPSSFIRSIFRRNVAESWGGAILTFNASYTAVNCEFYENVAGQGGADLQPNDYDNIQDEVNIVNSTFSNTGEESLITAWRDGNGDEANVIVQNTILAATNAFEYLEGETLSQVSEGGLTSSGGNLATMDLAQYLDQASDLNSTDPLFEQSQGTEVYLSAASPAINNGVSDGAPDFDLLLNRRSDTPDIGAYEFGGVTGIWNSNELSEVSIFPNPASDEINVELPEGFIPSRGELVSIGGKNSAPLQLPAGVSNQLRVRLSHLPNGTYILLLHDGNETRGGKLQIVR